MLRSLIKNCSQIYPKNKLLKPFNIVKSQTQAFSSVENPNNPDQENPNNENQQSSNKDQGNKVQQQDQQEKQNKKRMDYDKKNNQKQNFQKSEDQQQQRNYNRQNRPQNQQQNQQQDQQKPRQQYQQQQQQQNQQQNQQQKQFQRQQQPQQAKQQPRDQQTEQQQQEQQPQQQEQQQQQQKYQQNRPQYQKQQYYQQQQQQQQENLQGLFLKQYHEEYKENNMDVQQGINNHQVLNQRITKALQYQNPNEYTLKILIESYTLKHDFQKALEYYSQYVKKNYKTNESINNLVFECYCKDKSSSFEELNKFFMQEFAKKGHIKQLYRQNINYYFKKLNQLDVQGQIDNLEFFIKHFDKHSFFQVDFSFMYDIFLLANTTQYAHCAQILAKIMDLSSPSESHQLSLTQKLKQEQVENIVQQQFEALNVKSILSNLLQNNQFEPFSKILYAMNSLKLFDNENAKKFVSFDDLVHFSLKSNQPVFFWVDMVAKIIDFSSKPQYLQQQFLQAQLQDCNILQNSLSKADLEEFFVSLHLIGALTDSQVLVLMDISLALKEYKYVIELHENYARYTGQKRKTFSYQKLIEAMIGLKSQNKQKTENPNETTIALLRKLNAESEQNTGAYVNQLTNKLSEIRCHILDGNYQEAFSQFYTDFLKQKIVEYQKDRLHNFLLLFFKQYHFSGENARQEEQIQQFVETQLDSKYLYQQWKNEKDNVTLVKALANKNRKKYPAFKKKVLQRYFFNILRKDILNEKYTIEERRQQINETIDEYEKEVIDNYEELDRQYIQDQKLKKVVFDGMIRVKAIQSNFGFVKRRISKMKDKQIEFTQTQTYLSYQKELQDIQVEVNKILGKPSNTPVDVIALYERLLDEDKYDSQSLLQYIKSQEQILQNNYTGVKIKTLTPQILSELIVHHEDLYQQATKVAKPNQDDNQEFIYQLILWGCESKNPFAIYLGESYCDICYTPLPENLVDMVSDVLDPFNDSEEFKEQVTNAQQIIGNIDRERVYFYYNEFSQKPQFIQIINELGKNPLYRDQAAYVLQRELAQFRYQKFGIPKELINQEIANK